MPSPKLITFAGPVGSSKTPIANYLSTRLNLPVYNNDAVRTEVIEDLGHLDKAEFEKRRDERIDFALQQGNSFILDASIDRSWNDYKDKVLGAGFEVILISLDLSREFLVRLYKAKGYHDSLKRLDDLMKEHEEFLAMYEGDIHVRITDENFGERLKIAYEKVKGWMG